VDILNDTQGIVNELQKTITELKPVLREKADEAETMSISINEEKTKAEAEKKIVADETAIVEEQASEVSKLQSSAQAELD